LKLSEPLPKRSDEPGFCFVKKSCSFGICQDDCGISANLFADVNNAVQPKSTKTANAAKPKGVVLPPGGTRLPSDPLQPGVALPPGEFWNGEGPEPPMPTRAGIPTEGAAFEIDPRDPISASLIAAAEQAANMFSKVCEREFNCKDASGKEIPVVAKVKMYEEHLRSGSFQKEMTVVDMTLQEFKEHFIICTKKYLIHHFHDVMSSQARRNLYEKMRTDPRLGRVGIMASDYAAVFSNHSQLQLNQTIQNVYLRSDFCSCNVCRGATLPEHFDACR
jgi:hypothetical protein